MPAFECSMDTAVKILNTYQGRDRVIRTTSYACFLLSGVTRSRVKERLCILGTQLSSCRTIMRLFDDILMLNYNLQYGFGKKEEDAFIRCLSVVRNCADQLFYPVEHIAWATDQQIIQFNGTSWWHSSTFLWLLSLYCNLLKNHEQLVYYTPDSQLCLPFTRNFQLAQICVSDVQKAAAFSFFPQFYLRAMRSLFILWRKHRTLVEKDCCGSHILRHEIREQIQIEVLSFVEYAVDLCNAIHWMPNQFLWAGKLELWQVGLLGFISSVVGMWKYVKLTFV